MKLLLLCTLGLLTLLFFACGDEEEVAPPPTATLTATPVPSATSVATPTGAPTPTIAWKTFTNTDYGFSFQYPSDWYLDVHGTYPDTQMDYMVISNYPTRPSPGVTPAPDLFWTEIVVIPNPERLTVPDWVSQFHSIPGMQADLVVSSRDVALGERAGLEQTVVEGEAPDDTPVYEHFFDLRDAILVISGPAVDSPWLSLHLQIVNGLVFR